MTVLARDIFFWMLPSLPFLSSLSDYSSILSTLISSTYLSPTYLWFTLLPITILRFSFPCIILLNFYLSLLCSTSFSLPEFIQKLCGVKIYLTWHRATIQYFLRNIFWMKNMRIPMTTVMTKVFITNLVIPILLYVTSPLQWDENRFRKKKFTQIST